MLQTLKTTLRSGWTTGTCATAAVHAAYTAMITGAFPEKVAILTPSGQTAQIDVVYTDTDGAHFTAGVIKDAGDDPDVTHGAEIRASVTAAAPDSGVIFRRGDGVGIVTRPGLPIAVGEVAINPVPRQMISACIESLAVDLGGGGDVIVTISVPNGEIIALKTWNPRLGIDGGISILGTTGIVRPFSCSAWIASIHRGIDVARANDIDHIAGATGATSETAVQKHYDLPSIALIDMGDFVGGLLKYLRRHPVPRLTIAGGFGKITKLAQGAIDLHSKRSQISFSDLARLAAEVKMPYEEVAAANSALHVLEMATPSRQCDLAKRVADDALTHARMITRDTETRLEVMIVGRDGSILAEARES